MNSPRITIDKLNRILNAWNTLAPEVNFGGINKQDFESFINVAKTARTNVERLENELSEAIAFRESCDSVALSKARMVKNGVIADPERGENSALYEQMGYIRLDHRKSGLTRKKKQNGQPD
jgi:hypothetical protein